MDATDAFEALFHSPRARNIVAELIIGKISSTPGKGFLSPQTIKFRQFALERKRSGPSSGLMNTVLPKEIKFNKPIKKERTVMDEVAFRKFELIEIIKVNYNSTLFRFSTGNPNLKLDIPIGKHVVIGFKKNDILLKRAYTPIKDTKGHFDLLVKRYETGEGSTYLHSLQVGDMVSMRGYYGAWVFNPLKHKCIIMFAAGTGITPMVPIMKQVFEEKLPIKLFLINSNKTEQDILLKDVLNQYKEYSNIVVHHLISTPQSAEYKPQRCDGGIIDDLVTSYVLEHVPDLKIEQDITFLICGPDSYCANVKELLTTFWNTKEYHIF